MSMHSQQKVSSLHYKGVDSVGARGASAPPLFWKSTHLVLMTLIVEWIDFQCHVMVHAWSKT